MPTEDLKERKNERESLRCMLSNWTMSWTWAGQLTVIESISTLFLGLEAVHKTRREVHEAAADQGDPLHPYTNMWLRGMQNVITCGKSIIPWSIRALLGPLVHLADQHDILRFLPKLWIMGFLDLPGCSREKLQLWNIVANNIDLSLM